MKDGWKPTLRGWIFAAAIACAFGPGAPARSADPLDMEAVRQSVREGLVAQLQVSVQSVTCPEKRDIKAGDTFDCTAGVEEVGRLTVTVTQKDDDGNIAWSVTKTEGLLDLVKLESAIKAWMEAHGGADVKVDCGGRFRGIRVGETFDCKTVEKDGENPTIRVTVKDAEGNVDWKAVEG